MPECVCASLALVSSLSLLACSGRPPPGRAAADAGGAPASTPTPTPTAAMPTPTAGAPAPVATPGTAPSLRYSIDRTAVPSKVYFRELTLKVKVGPGVTGVAVSVDGKATPSTYDGTNVTFTTAGSAVELLAQGADAAGAGFGTVTKAALKHDRRWAYSFGFDDDQGFKYRGIPFAEKLGFRGTLFIMNKDGNQLLRAGANESWSLDETDVAVLNEGGTIDDPVSGPNPAIRIVTTGGWAVGNHTWSHKLVSDFPSVADAKADVLAMQDRLRAILDRSAPAPYRVTAFASPMFDPAYLPIVLDIREHDPTPGHELLFVESGSTTPVQVDAPIDRSAPIGRAYTYGLGTGKDDPVAAVQSFRPQLDERHHYWLNTFEHGVDSTWPDGPFFRWLQQLHDTWGPGGTNEVWVAPSDEIYSYLLVRDLATVTRS